MGRKNQSSPSSATIYEKKNGNYTHLHCAHCFQQVHGSTSIHRNGHFSFKDELWYCSTNCYHLKMFETSTGPYADPSMKAQYSWLVDKKIPTRVIHRRKLQLPLDVVDKTLAQKKNAKVIYESKEKTVVTSRKERIESLMREIEAESPFVGTNADFPTL